MVQPSTDTMGSYDRYSDDDLQRLADKMQGVQGGKDRLEAILAALDARSVKEDDLRQNVIRDAVGVKKEP